MAPQDKQPDRGKPTPDKQRPSNDPKGSPPAKPVASAATNGDDRRNFVVRLAAGVIGAIVGLAPLAAGLVTFFDPLFRRAAAKEKAIRVARLEDIPDGGAVVRFPVIDERHDKWNTYPPAPIGAVFLRRDPATGKLRAYSAVCPHLGCAVDFKATLFQCPCHNSSWQPDGQRIDPERCPSPRDLDELIVDIRNETEVWVVYKRFRGGVADKIEE